MDTQPNQNPNLIDRILSAAGMSRGSSYRIRFGGFVGKTAWICTVAELPVMVVAYRSTDTTIQLACLGAAIAIAVIGVIVASRFAEKNPTLAMLEGAQVVALQELQNQFAAKGVREIPVLPTITKTLEATAIEPQKGS